MIYKIIYIYDSSVNLDNVPDKIVEDLISGEVEEAIANCMELKREGVEIPIGFSIISFDEYDLNICETKNYYFNGTIIDKNNLPKEWLNEKLLNKDIRKLVYINENFCVPFNDETDKILHITNL